MACQHPLNGSSVQSAVLFLQRDDLSLFSSFSSSRHRCFKVINSDNALVQQKTRNRSRTDWPYLVLVMYQSHQ